MAQSGKKAVACPCGLGASYEECCGRWHHSTTGGSTPEQVMRSRYTAFAIRDSRYLLRTWHPSTRPHDLDLVNGPRYTRLEVLESSGGTLFEREGTVLFHAHYIDSGMPGMTRERSRFVREDGQWYYLGPVES